MKISAFKGSGVNGYLDFDLEFNEDLTFVTGINGTGKTSVLNSIISLLYPRFDYLASAVFDEISIIVTEDIGDAELTAIKDGNETRIFCSEASGEPLILYEFEANDALPGHRMREMEEEYYKEFLAKNSEHSVIKFLSELPTPMFLGLDRRTLSSEVGSRRYAVSPFYRSGRRNIFGRSLSQSLDESLHFAQDQYQTFLRKEARLDAKFRQKLIFALMDFPPIGFGASLAEPSEKELRSIDVARRNLRKLPELLKVPKEFIESKVDPMFDFLEERLNLIKGKSENKQSDDEILTTRDVALIEWSYNKTQIGKINSLSKIVSEHNRESDQIFRRLNEFLEMVNSFIGDSEKTVYFDRLGFLKFNLGSETEERDIRTLSSGEIQMIVILTHLFFNPEVERANVFIIDEPELSLHVQWQEKFVNALMDASEETQFIMATHSPSIILDRVDRCVEVVGRK